MGKAKALPVPMAMDTREEWFEAFDQAIVNELANNRVFSADDLRESGTLPEPGNSSWWGAGFRRAIAGGLIKHVGFNISRTPSRNGGVLRTWEPRQHPKG